MLTVRFGGKVFGPGVFMFEDEAFQVKQELLARGTKLALKLAGEIGMPSDGMIHGGEKFENRGKDAAAQDGRAE